MNSLMEELEIVDRVLERVKNTLKAEEQVSLSTDLLRALLSLEERYKEVTLEQDAMDDLPPGTTYHDDYGVPIEFYIEQDDWHDISLALRVWKSNNPNWPEMLNLNVDNMIDIPIPPDDD